MRLKSAQDLKSFLLANIVEPIVEMGARRREARPEALALDIAPAGMTGSLFSVGARPVERLPERQRSLALGVAPYGKGYRLAVRLQRPALLRSPLVEHLRKQARGEVDIRLVGRIDKRARTRGRRRADRAAPAVPWYQANTRPLLIGASVGHVEVTAGTIGGFVDRGGAAAILSNNHVLANEDRGTAGDIVLQRAWHDGGRRESDSVARLSQWVTLKRRGSNIADAAVAELIDDVAHDPRRLRGLVNGKDRSLKGLGPEFLDEGTLVYKVGRTTGSTTGRVTAFDLDNIVVNYDMGNLRFDGQIEIEGTGNWPFSDGGDSGSLIVDARMQAVALLFAGSDTGGRNGAGLTYANPIHDILEELNVTLLS
jgi:hypothetical protein